MDDSLYVILYEKDGVSGLYHIHRTSFVGSYAEAKVALLEIKEWQPDVKYKLCKLMEVE